MTSRGLISGHQSPSAPAVPQPLLLPAPDETASANSHHRADDAQSNLQNLADRLDPIGIPVLPSEFAAKLIQTDNERYRQKLSELPKLRGMIRKLLGEGVSVQEIEAVVDDELGLRED